MVECGMADDVPPGLPPLAEEDHVCSFCRMAYQTVGLDEARATLRALPEQITVAATAVPAELRAVRPARDTWSVVEYACHVRDVLAGNTIRLYRMRTEERPTFEPLFGDLRALRFRYTTRDLDAVLAELASNVAGFLDESAAVIDWERTGSRLPGEERSARWLLRHTAHEGVHHVRDIEVVARTVGSNPTLRP
jgi:DinB family protein